VSDRREYEWRTKGFIAFDHAQGFSATLLSFSGQLNTEGQILSASSETRKQSCRVVSNFTRLGNRSVPYLFIVQRLAHYLKVLPNVSPRLLAPPSACAEYITGGLRQYVADQDLIQTPRGCAGATTLRRLHRIYVSDYWQRPARAMYRVGLSAAHFKLTWSGTSPCRWSARWEKE